VLAMRTPLLVLDEPMAGLDPRGRHELFDLLMRLREQRDLTLVMCSSSLAETSLICDRLVVLREGAVLMDGPVREVLRETERLSELGITLPEPASCARELRKILPDLRADLLTENELEEELLARLGAGGA
jgi:energy-coupling factor transport system ATP-binding protein